MGPRDIIQSMKPLIPSTPKDRFVLAVSGGVDSMVLLSHYQNTQCRVVHFNFHKRQESELDEALVRQQATRYGLPCTVIHAPEWGEGNFQEQARTYRYDILTDIARTQGFDAVLVAHHQDDVLETLLMQWLRGTSFQHWGLEAQVEWNQTPLRRPLLSFPKATLLAYAAHHTIPYRDDASNNDTAFLRNRLRHEVLPTLLELQPQLHEKSTHLVAQSQRFKATLNEWSDPLFRHPSRQLFRDASPLIQDHTLLRWCHAHRIEPHHALLQLLKQVITSEEAQRKVQLSKEFWCVVEYDDIAFRKLQTASSFHIEINAHGEYELPNHDIVMISTHKPKHGICCVLLDETQIRFPLAIRTRLPGDRMAFSFGHQSLSDYLINKKVPNHERDALWVLAKDHDVLWIPAMQWRTKDSTTPSLYIYLKDKTDETHA